MCMKNSLINLKSSISIPKHHSMLYRKLRVLFRNLFYSVLAYLSGPKVSLETHLLTFAAEESRLSGAIVRPNEDPRWMVR